MQTLNYESWSLPSTNSLSLSLPLSLPIYLIPLQSHRVGKWSSVNLSQAAMPRNLCSLTPNHRSATKSMDTPHPLFTYHHLIGGTGCGSLTPSPWQDELWSSLHWIIFTGIRANGGSNSNAGHNITVNRQDDSSVTRN
jgi:hypothetical protein